MIELVKQLQSYGCPFQLPFWLQLDSSSSGTKLMSLLSSLFAPDWRMGAIGLYPVKQLSLIHGRSAEDGGWLTAGAGEDSDSEREMARSVPPESTAAERSDDEVQRPLPSIKSMWRLMLQPFKRSGK